MKKINTVAEHEQALALASKLFKNPPDLSTPEGGDFKELLLAIDAYEQEAYPLGTTKVE